ncbi:MAG: 16S rRNA (cytosine(1402)-N(4))-methyltransferase RsmH [Planctomycetota bacterium]
MADGHVPVLLDEVVGLLGPRPGDRYADLTAGLGGHASAVAAKLGGDGLVVLNDLDGGNLERATARVRGEHSGVEVRARRGSFAEVPFDSGLAGVPFDCVLADLGFASNQVDDPSRGLSFREDGPLDMRLDPDGPMTAAEIVNETPERELADLIYRYGEERASRRVAGAIVRRRQERRFERTQDLAEVVRKAVPGAGRGGGRQRIDGATRTFQALRIAVNGELEMLESLLASVEAGARAAVEGRAGWLAAGARVALISFHSLEDRPIKQAFAAMEQTGLGRRLTRKPVVAGEAESAANRRARSAKLRGFLVGGGAEEKAEKVWSGDGSAGR